MRNKRWLKVLGSVAIVVTLALVLAAMLVRRTYVQNLKPASTDDTVMTVTIEKGSSASEIADLLKNQGLIRSDWAFEWYIRSQNARDKLQAGTYELRPSQSISEIVAVLTRGLVATDMVTIVPGRSLEQIKESLRSAGYDEEEINDALNPTQYADHPALSDKPREASLEGYLYPETFQTTEATDLSVVIEAMLDELQKRLTPDVRAGIARHGLSVHQGVILASIIEREVPKPEERAQAAQVFLKRLSSGMRLESDAARYTYENSGLPPEPISNFSASAIEAVANPAATDYLYFVSGRDCVTRFGRTLEEHNAFIQTYGVRDSSIRCENE